MTNHCKVAATQMQPIINEKNENMKIILTYINKAHDNGAQIIIFPECAITGYCFKNISEIESISEQMNGESVTKIHNHIHGLNVIIVIGFIEEYDKKYYNSIAIIDSSGVIGTYRKIHLPYLGADKFVNKGNLPLNVCKTVYGKIGPIICYDGLFPETSRVLALQGADMIVLPTNWPDDSIKSAKYVSRTRAIENKVYFIAVNRIGQERGISFLGMSRIIDPNGNVLASASKNSSEILYATLDLDLSRNKKEIVIPQEYEMDIFNDRCPEHYKKICQQF